MTPRRTATLVLTPVLGIALYVTASAEPVATWARVALDPNYEIAIDTARIRAGRVSVWGRWYPVSGVWYRTTHKMPRLHNGKTFDREIVHSVIQCDSLWFQVISVDMSMGGGKPIARQRMSEDEVRDQPWRRVERGTTEEIAAIAACHFGKRQPVQATQR